MRDYTDAIKINPNLATAFENRGILYREVGDKKKALADYNKAIEINPNDPMYYINRAQLYFATESDRRLSKIDLLKAKQLVDQGIFGFNIPETAKHFITKTIHVNTDIWKKTEDISNLSYILPDDKKEV